MTTIEMQIADERTPAGPQLTLPSRCYTDAAIYARELETIFGHCWQPIGHACDVKEPGSYTRSTRNRVRTRRNYAPGCCGRTVHCW